MQSVRRRFAQRRHEFASLDGGSDAADELRTRPKFIGVTARPADARASLAFTRRR
jgi:hypothetical protein